MKKAKRHNGSSIRVSHELVERLQLFKRQVGVKNFDILIWEAFEHPDLLSYLVDRNQDTSFSPSEAVLQQLRQRDFELTKNKFLVRVDE